jgi:two-component system, LuxR family, response regulator FixJ
MSTPRRARYSSGNMSKTRPHVAVVDDEHSICVALQRLIRSAGMAVTTYGSGEEFLQELDTVQPDCVVLDLHMPKVTGFEVQSSLAKRTQRIPVIVVTGHDTPEARTRALNNGAAAYLLKPVDDRMLLDAIAAAIADKVA